MTAKRTFTIEELELAWNEGYAYATWGEDGVGPKPPSDFKNFLYTHFPAVKTYQWQFTYEVDEVRSEIFIADNQDDAIRQAWSFLNERKLFPVYTQLTKVIE